MNDTNDNKLTIKLFKNRASAEKAFNAALECGYKPEEISIIMSEKSRKNYYDSELIKAEGDDGSIKNLGLGGALGGLIGGTIAALIALAIPGLGIVIVGPLAGAGSISGGLLGSLIGWGIPEENSVMYEKEIQQGSIILAVKELPGRAPLLWDSNI